MLCQSMEGLRKQGIQLLGDNDSDCVDANRSGGQRPGRGVSRKSRMLRIEDVGKSPDALAG